MTTKAQRAGFVENVTRLKLKSRENSCQSYHDGYYEKVWILQHDDGSSCPYFKSEDGSVRDFCAYVCDFELAKVSYKLAVPGTLPVPFIKRGYTALQQKAIDTFQGMYDAAMAYREGLPTGLNSGYGICDNIDRYADKAGADSYQMSEVKENFIRKTPMYSGEYHYPVPCPEGGDAGQAFTRYSDKWSDTYGLNRLTQLGQLIHLLKTEWSDDLVGRKSPAFRNGLVVGDLVRYERRGESSIWVFRHDDGSMTPSFHRIGDIDDYDDLDLSYVKKINKEDILRKRAVAEFLSELEEKVKEKSDIERQIAELQKSLKNVEGDISILDYGLAYQHKVKRI